MPGITQTIVIVIPLPISWSVAASAAFKCWKFNPPAGMSPVDALAAPPKWKYAPVADGIRVKPLRLGGTLIPS